MLVLGVDPGQTSCGLVVRDGATLITHATVIRNKSWDRGEWVDHCLTEALDLLPESGGPHLTAIEDVNTPNAYHEGRKQIISPVSAIETALLAGAFLAWRWYDDGPTVLVPPNRNGQGPLTGYPEPLRPTRGKGAGADNLRHCRSAWDVAGTGLLLANGKRLGAYVPC